MKGFVLTPDTTFAAAPPLDLLLVPGDLGQEALMEDEAVLALLRTQAAGGGYILFVRTGALLLGAAALLRGARATAHWPDFHLLKYFGALPMQARVVVDRKFVSAAGVLARLRNHAIIPRILHRKIAPAALNYHFGCNET